MSLGDCGSQVLAGNEDGDEKQPPPSIASAASCWLMMYDTAVDMQTSSPYFDRVIVSGNRCNARYIVPGTTSRARGGAVY
jgi:hypothetical protein